GAEKHRGKRRIELNATYDCYEDLEAAVKIYEDTNFEKLYIRDSSSIERAKKRAPKRIFKNKLKFFEIKYACKYGGRIAKSKSKGARPNQGTCSQLKCGFNIKILTTADGQKLQVKSINRHSEHQKHNHPCTEELYRRLACERKPDQDLEKEVIDMLIAGEDKKKILIYVHQTTNGKKMMTLKDLNNLKMKMKLRPDLIFKREEPCKIEVEASDRSLNGNEDEQNLSRNREINQKYENAHVICTRIAAVVANKDTENFKKAMKCLQLFEEKMIDNDFNFMDCNCDQLFPIVRIEESNDVQIDPLDHQWRGDGGSGGEVFGDAQYLRKFMQI
ncbi:unnamed protein product, partial [Meganyctiphanes norvegica]